MKNFILLITLLISSLTFSQTDEKAKERFKVFAEKELLKNYKQIEQVPLFLYDKLKKIEQNKDLSNSFFHTGVIPDVTFKHNNKDKYYLIYKNNMTFIYENDELIYHTESGFIDTMYLKIKFYGNNEFYGYGSIEDDKEISISAFTTKKIILT